MIVQLKQLKFSNTVVDHKAKGVRDQLVASLKSRFGKIEDDNLISSAAILDPRVKDRSFISSELKRKAVMRVLKETKEYEKTRSLSSVSLANECFESNDAAQSNKRIKLDVFAFIK